MARARRVICDESSDDDFPSLQELGRPTKTAASALSSQSSLKQKEQPSDTIRKATIVRRRRLGAMVDNPLLRPLNERCSSQKSIAEEPYQRQPTMPGRIESRSRKTKPVVKSVEIEGSSEAESVIEETIIEDFSDGASDFEASQSSESDFYDSDADLFMPRSPPKSRAKSRVRSSQRGVSSEKDDTLSPGAQLVAEAIEQAQRKEEKQGSRSQGGSDSGKGRAKGKTSLPKPGKSGSKDYSAGDLVEPLSKLKLNDFGPLKPRKTSPELQRPTTPTSPLPKSQPKAGLASPQKLSRIPATPHRPHMDTFWSQEFVDEWNDEHSPKKQIFLPEVNKSPSKKSLSKKELGQAVAQVKATRKAFSQSKHDLADKFLRELDERITNGKIQELAASTGGIRIDWTNKLNTTAGRANWKRETIRSKVPDGETTTRYKHHASIELAEKVIDDEDRLLNVIAHEFCHLANFMITGMTSNPHGKEFKAWASKCSREFGNRGIEVTTKHSYDIDFKYIWECTMCGLEFKRHSKSIQPERHRCGSCKSELRQTKPVPRAKSGKTSEYQKFMKEQMKIIKEQNPGSPQKDIMKLVASKWSEKESAVTKDKNKVDGVGKALDKLTLVDLTPP